MEMVSFKMTQNSVHAKYFMSKAVIESSLTEQMLLPFFFFGIAGFVC